jgi:hypothetical protein
MDFKRSAGCFVAKSKTDLVSSGGICFLIICPAGTSQISSGSSAPDPTLIFSQCRSDEENAAAYFNARNVGKFEAPIVSLCEVVLSAW